MALGLKSFWVFAFFACASLVVAGGSWVHHNHGDQLHAHDSSQLAKVKHAHAHDGEPTETHLDNLIHCGSDNVWFQAAWSPPHKLEATAVGTQKDVLAFAAFLQLEDPPPRLITKRA